MDNLWYTRVHNEFGAMTFINMMIASDDTEADFRQQTLNLSMDDILERRRNWRGWKLWILVNDDDGVNLARADAYAKAVHGAEDWRHFVNYMSGSAEIKVEDGK